MERSRTSQCSASAARVANSTALALSTGNAPGRPRHTGQILVLGSEPNRLAQPQKALVLVSSCTWTSSPMTGSYLARISGESDVASIPDAILPRRLEPDAGPAVRVQLLQHGGGGRAVAVILVKRQCPSVAVINRRDPGVLVGETPCLKCRASRLLKADVQQVFIVLSLHGQIGGIVVRQTDIHLGELHFKPERGESSNIPVERVEVVELVEAGADMELKPDTGQRDPALHEVLCHGIHGVRFAIENLCADLVYKQTGSWVGSVRPSQRLLDGSGALTGEANAWRVVPDGAAHRAVVVEGLVHYVPRIYSALVVPHHVRNVTCKHAVEIRRSPRKQPMGDPSRQLLLPHQVVPAHPHGMGLREGHQLVRRGIVVGCWLR